MTASTTFWDAIYRKTSPEFLGLCRRYIKDLNVAEDLLHDAFSTAMQKQNTYAQKGEIEAWLRKIVVNTVLQYLRKSNQFILQSIDNQDFIDDDFIGENTDFTSQQAAVTACDFTKAELLEVIDTLPLHHKIVFNLYVFEKYSHQAIADELHISAGTSKSHLARARKKIQQLLFEKAVEMKKKEENKRKMALLFFDEDNHFIDTMMSDKLQDLSVSPQKKFDFLEKKTNFIPRKWFFPIAIFAVATVCLLMFFLSKKEEKQVVTDSKPTLIDTPVLQTEASSMPADKEVFLGNKTDKKLAEKTVKTTEQNGLKKQSKSESRSKNIAADTSTIIIKQPLIIKKNILLDTTR